MKNYRIDCNTCNTENFGITTPPRLALYSKAYCLTAKGYPCVDAFTHRTYIMEVYVEIPHSETRRERKMENKSNCLMSKDTDFMQYEGPRIITLNGRKVRVLGIRRLTPTECARLQTIPEWYKWECSDSQAYRMLGNGWTVEVIKHFFKELPFEREMCDRIESEVK